ncbi:30S ribosomal protein S4 [Patescibacteria group bacterium]|nr:30S ribosomal protein S4 [Patescibacteria group bacterium]
MGRYTEAKCRRCRRAMEKLFLKGDRCVTAKCGLVRRASVPGVHGKNKTSKSGMSEYGMQLMAKQKIKRMYGILERQFRKHFDEIKNKPGVTGDLLLSRLELRLDNAVYRINFASSRSQARQIVNHGLIAVNGRKVNIPSYAVRVGDVISINPFRKEKNYFKNLNQVLKNKTNFPSWISFNKEKLEGKIVNVPTRQDSGVDVNVQMVVEYYSR